MNTTDRKNTMNTIKIKEKNKILGSSYEQEIVDLRSAGMELQAISDLMWQKRNYKVSQATLTRFFQLKKDLGHIAVQDVKTELKEVYKEEYIDLAGRVAYYNELVAYGKERFEKEKQNLTLIDAIAISLKAGYNLQKIEGADVQSDMVQIIAKAILDSKTETRPVHLPIIEVLPDGSSREIFDNEAQTNEQKKPAEA
jgi:hypothetical protein